MKKITILAVCLLLFTAGCSFVEKIDVLDISGIKAKKEREELAAAEQEKANQQIIAKYNQKVFNKLKELQISDITASQITNIVADKNNDEDYIYFGDPVKCGENLTSLTKFARCFAHNMPILPKYVVVSLIDMRYWIVSQRLNNGSLIMAGWNPNIIIFIDGNLKEIDNQVLRNTYLFKVDGTVTYNTVLGATKTVYKLKILSNLTEKDNNQSKSVDTKEKTEQNKSTTKKTIKRQTLW